MRLFHYLLSVFLATVLIGCTTFKPMPVTSTGSSTEIAAGDEIKIETLSGQYYAFTVTHIDAETIQGEAVIVPIKDIKSIEKRETSFGKTLTLLLGIAILVKESSSDFVDDLEEIF